MFVCLFVCLSIRLRISKTTLQISLNFLYMLPVARQCDTSCTSSLMDDVMFSYNAGNRPESDDMCFIQFVRWRHRRRSLTSASCLVRSDLSQGLMIWDANLSLSLHKSRQTLETASGTRNRCDDIKTDRISAYILPILQCLHGDTFSCSENAKKLCR